MHDRAARSRLRFVEFPILVRDIDAEHLMAELLTVRKIDKWLSSDEIDATTSALPLIDISGKGVAKTRDSAPTTLVLAIDPRPVDRLWELEFEVVSTEGKPE